ncbi:MAG: PIN domain-containing protein [Solirubrobacterales bacterium]
MARSRRGNRLTAYLDTNVLIRHLTGDPPEMARRATRLLGSENRLILTDLVTAECVYVLKSFYKVEEARIAELMRAAFALQAIDVPGLNVLLRSLELFVEHRLGFADAYLVASAELTGIGEVASFDEGIDRIKTVNRVMS